MYRGLAVTLTAGAIVYPVLGWDTIYQQVVQGALILGAVGFDRSLRGRRS
ncbi:hypothetical protein AB0M95_19270 [Sphaerisporangium sp. NPDC051017]